MPISITCIIEALLSELVMKEGQLVIHDNKQTELYNRVYYQEHYEVK